MIVVVDYKAGNLTSVAKAFAHLGENVRVTGDPSVIAAATKVVLPGVGHFATTAALDHSGMRDAIAQAIHRGVPFLGICVGMQWLYDSSEEDAGTPGLGLFGGACSRFSPEVKSPHVGWNRLEKRGTPRLLKDLDNAPFVYFTHSFRAPVTSETSGVTSYGEDFAAAIERDNIFGVQFHPEKSGAAGLAVLRNFVELPC